VVGSQENRADAAAGGDTRGHDGGAGPVGEQRHGVTVGGIEEAGEDLGADHQRVPGPA